MLPGLLGFLAGALIYGATYPAVFPKIAAIQNLGNTILPQWLEINLWLTIAFFVLITLTFFYFLERHGDLRKDKMKD